MRPRHAFAPLCCALMLAACASPAPRGAAKVALVIGNSAYDSVPSLANPAHDAADMCAALKRAGFQTTCVADLRDRAEFEARVKAYVDQLGPRSIGVVYYAGHGVQVGQANFLIPTQASPRTASEAPSRALYALDDLFDRLRPSGAYFQMVILDACRTDLFAPPKGAAGRGAAAKAPLVRSLETAGRAANGFAPITHAPPSTFVLFATASGEAAFEGEGRNGPLTKHVLQHIGSKGLSVEDFIKRVMAGVANETARDYRSRQTPYVYGSFTGRFCFAGCPGGDPPPIY